MKQGGMLFILPRELRDEIYRHLVKGIYHVGDTTPSQELGRMVEPEERLVILRVSKIIGDEAETILYSESTFRIDAGFKWDEAYVPPPHEALDRMMNMALIMSVGMHIQYADFGLSEDVYLQYLTILRRARRATMNRIIHTNTIRNILYVKCRLYTPDVKQGLPGWIYARLRELTRFRTVVLELSPELQTRVIDGTRYSRTDGGEDAVNELDRKVKDISYCLKDLLGPAVLGHVHDPGHEDYTKTLTFHPQKHMPATLRRRAASLRAEAARLDREADRAEVGNERRRISE